MKYIQTFESFLNESSDDSNHKELETALNELKLSSVGVKELLTAIYYNWDKIKDRIRDEYYFRTFKDVIAFMKSGDQEEQQHLENVVKGLGIEVLKLQ